MEKFGDDFNSNLPLDVLRVLLDLGRRHGLDPTSSIESEAYFSKILGEFQGPENELHDWIEARITRDFHFLTSMPEWIQNPQWQFANGKPMVFVGQVVVPASLGYFHDDAAFYVFWDPLTGEARTIIQVA